MTVVKITIYHVDMRSTKNEWKLVKTQYVEKDSDKKMTGKKAGQILANTFPAFDRLATRNGLQKHNEGFLTMKPLDKGNHIWEYALISEHSE